MQDDCRATIFGNIIGRSPQHLRRIIIIIIVPAAAVIAAAAAPMGGFPLGSRTKVRDNFHIIHPMFQDRHPQIRSIRRPRTILVLIIILVPRGSINGRIIIEIVRRSASAAAAVRIVSVFSFFCK